MDYEVKVDEYGNKKWYLYGKLHREDGPAIEFVNGHKEWSINGNLHRVDGPAVEWVNGSREWWINGKLHREDGPAVDHKNRDKEWWLNGRKFRGKEAWFKALNKKAKEKVLFSEHFILG